MDLAFFTVLASLSGCGGGGGGGGSSSVPSFQNVIVFENYLPGNSEIYVVNLDGSGAVNLTNSSEDDGAPSSHPDGSKIAFGLHDGFGNYNICTINSSGGNQNQLTNSNSDYLPVYSPDGSKIAFMSNRDGNPDIYVMNADGSGQTRLTTSPGFDGYPDWSPDGSRIAFASDAYSPGSVSNLYVMNADGSNVVRVTDSQLIDAFPAWSPDGLSIAFERAGQIWTMAADGSNQTEIQNGVHDSESVPSWSPDGQKIAYCTYTQFEGWNLSVMDSNGGNDITLVSDIENNEWRPRFARIRR